MVPGEEFSNINEAEKKAYFHFSAEGPMGRIQGQDTVALPPDCDKIAWNASTRKLCYVTPQLRAAAAGASELRKESAGGSLVMLWWILMAVCAAAGIGLWLVPVLVKARQTPGATQPTSPEA